MTARQIIAGIAIAIAGVAVIVGVWKGMAWLEAPGIRIHAERENCKAVGGRWVYDPNGVNYEDGHCEVPS